MKLITIVKIVPMAARRCQPQRNCIHTLRQHGKEISTISVLLRFDHLIRPS